MSDREKFQSFLSRIAPLVKESGLPLKLLTDAVEVAYLQSGIEEWSKVNRYMEELLEYSTEELILLTLANIIDTKEPTRYALSMALRERAKREK